MGGFDPLSLVQRLAVWAVLLLNLFLPSFHQKHRLCSTRSRLGELPLSFLTGLRRASILLFGTANPFSKGISGENPIGMGKKRTEARRIIEQNAVEFLKAK